VSSSTSLVNSVSFLLSHLLSNCHK